VEYVMDTVSNNLDSYLLEYLEQLSTDIKQDMIHNLELRHMVPATMLSNCEYQRMTVLERIARRQLYPIIAKQTTLITEELKRNKVNIIHIKGITDAYELYDVPYVRSIRDIDIIVHPKDICTACQVMKCIGYVTVDNHAVLAKQMESVRIDDTRHSIDYFMKHNVAGLLKVDMHYSLLSKYRIDVRKLFERAVITEWDGAYI